MIDRLKDTIARLVEELIPERRFMVPARYRVEKCEGGKLTAKPEKDKSGLPPIVDMPVRGGIAGGMSATKLKKGTSVVVMWIDGSQADPFLAWIDEAEEPDELALEGQTKATLKAPDVKLEAATKVTIDAPLTEIGTAPTGVATLQTMTPQLALEAAERTALLAFLNFAGIVAVSGGTAAAAATAITAAATGAALPTNFSQTVKGGA